MPQPPTLAKPSRHIFDPFNSSATGHQRAGNRLSGSTSWRDSRAQKLQVQFSAGVGGDGGKRVSDTVGAGSLAFGRDGRTESGGWVHGAPGLRAKGQRCLWEFAKVAKNRIEGDGDEDGEVNGDGGDDASSRPSKKRKLEQTHELQSTNVVNPFTPYRQPDGSVRESSWTAKDTTAPILEASQHTIQSLHSRKKRPVTRLISPPESAAESAAKHSTAAQPQPSQSALFANLVFFINGSTLPTISDHKLKYLLTSHGGHLSVSLARRTVTHVILGTPNSSLAGVSGHVASSDGGAGCGGGLAASKIQKEIARVGGKNVRFVRVEWVVESVKAGRRLAESRFEVLWLAQKGVGSIAAAFGKGNG